MDILDNLNAYMNKVFDVDGSGSVSFKEVLLKLTHSAPAIALIVVDILVLAAEFRVWDMGMQMTQNGWKAIGFVLVSAVPFYLAQLLWIYPRGNFWQKFIGVIVGIGGLVTSAVFGRADLFFGYDLQLDASYLLTMVVLLTVGYIVALLVFILIDPSIRAWFIKIQLQARTKQEREFLDLTRQAMKDIAETQKLQRDIENEFSDPEAVRGHLDRLHGKHPVRPQERPQQTQRQMAVNSFVATAEQAKMTNSPTNGAEKD